MRLALIVLLLCAPPGFAQSTGGEDRALVERLALARARSHVVAQVYELEIKPGLAVGHWVARDAGFDRAVRLWLRGLSPHGGVRVYSDLSAEADVRIEPAEIVAGLRRLSTGVRLDGGEAVGPADLEAAARRWPVVWGRGSGSGAERGRSQKPPGWEDITLAGIELARRAASEDALAALLDSAGRLKLTTARLLRDFVASNAEISPALSEAFARTARVRVDFALDQVAVAEASVSVADLIRLLAEVHRNLYQGDEYHAADFRQMALWIEADELRASGMAVAPARERMTGEFRLLELDVPTWAAESFEAIGRYVPSPVIDEQLPEATQAELARFDAADQLRRRIERLPVQGDVTVSEILSLNPDLKPDVVLFLGGVRPVGPPLRAELGVVEQKVELPLRKLWEIVRRGLQAVEVDPPVSQPGSQPESAPASLPTTGGNG